MHHSSRRINDSRNHIRRRDVIDENGNVIVDISTTRSHPHRRHESQTLHPSTFVGRRPDTDSNPDDSYRRRRSNRPSSRTDSVGLGNPTARHDRRTGRPRETRQLNHDTKRSKNDAVPDLHASSSASPRGEIEKGDEQSSDAAKKEGKAWKAPELSPHVEESEDDEDEGAYSNPLNTFGGAIESGDEEEESLISQQTKSNGGKTKNEEADLDHKPASSEKGPEGKKTSLLEMFKRLNTPSSSK